MSFSRVLVVEDNADVRRMVTAGIKTLGEDIEVFDVPSAEEALVVNASQPLDLIVLDIHLPGMSGFDMVARLRKRKPGIKLILVTGIEDETLRKQVVELNPSAYFFKPIEIQAFLDAVKRCLSPALPLSGAQPKPSAPAAIRPIISPTAQTAPISHSHAEGHVSVENSKPMPADDNQPNLTMHDRLVELKKQLKAVERVTGSVSRHRERPGSRWV